MSPIDVRHMALSNFLQATLVLIKGLALPRGYSAIR